MNKNRYRDRRVVNLNFWYSLAIVMKYLGFGNLSKKFLKSFKKQFPTTKNTASP